MMAIAAIVPHYLLGIAGGAALLGIFMPVAGTVPAPSAPAQGAPFLCPCAAQPPLPLCRQDRAASAGNTPATPTAASARRWHLMALVRCRLHHRPRGHPEPDVALSHALHRVPHIRYPWHDAQRV